MKKFQVTVDAELEPIMPRYLEIRMEELAKLEHALSSGDDETVRMLGHKLKGTGTSYGFTRLTELGAAIERAGRGGDLPQANELTTEVRTYLENVEVVYEEQS